LVNVLVLKSRKKRKNQTKGQHVNEESKSQINPSKFKISDLDRDQASERTQDAHHDDHQFRHLNTENRHIENDKRK
ncbi:MFS transporter, partial [Staphylococcus aureus]|nr:MFS transporter [Staphylococcus aureus]